MRVAIQSWYRRQKLCVAMLSHVLLLSRGSLCIVLRRSALCVLLLSHGVDWSANCCEAMLVCCCHW